MAANTVVYWEQLRDFIVFEDMQDDVVSYTPRKGYALVATDEEGNKHLVQSIETIPGDEELDETTILFNINADFVIQRILSNGINLSFIEVFVGIEEGEDC